MKRKARQIAPLVVPALGSMLALNVVPAWGQQAPAPTPPAGGVQQMERVEITGSSIKRVESETALPVTVITREQIEKSGAVNVEQLMARVSAGNALVSDTNQGVEIGRAHV